MCVCVCVCACVCVCVCVCVRDHMQENCVELMWCGGGGVCGRVNHN